MNGMSDKEDFFRPFFHFLRFVLKGSMATAFYLLDFTNNLFVYSETNVPALPSTYTLVPKAYKMMLVEICGKKRFWPTKLRLHWQTGNKLSKLTLILEWIVFQFVCKKEEGRTESHEQHFFACELGTADEGECGGRWNQLLCYPWVSCDVNSLHHN